MGRLGIRTVARHIDLALGGAGFFGRPRAYCVLGRSQSWSCFNPEEHPRR